MFVETLKITLIWLCSIIKIKKDANIPFNTEKEPIDVSRGVHGIER